MVPSRAFLRSKLCLPDVEVAEAAAAATVFLRIPVSVGTGRYSQSRASAKQRVRLAPHPLPFWRALLNVLVTDRTTHAPPRPYLGLSAPYIGDEEIEELLDAIRSGWLTSGPKVDRRSRTAWRPICTPRTCAASPPARPGSRSRCGCRDRTGRRGAGPEHDLRVVRQRRRARRRQPVLVDSEPATGLIDLDHAESLVTSRTRAVMPVHLAGFPVDLDAVNALRDRHGIAVVEDAAHAIGARWRGRPDRRARQPHRVLLPRDEEHHHVRGRRPLRSPPTPPPSGPAASRCTGSAARRGRATAARPRRHTRSRSRASSSR